MVTKQDILNLESSKTIFRQAETDLISAIRAAGLIVDNVEYSNIQNPGREADDLLERMYALFGKEQVVKGV